MTKDIRPFLPVAASPTRSLGTALPAIATPEVMSPWSPRPVVAPDAPPPAPSPDDIAAIHDEARRRGHAEGLAQTAQLRARLAALLDELAAARAAIAAPAGELVAELAACVVETWTEGADRGALFAPVVRGWLAQAPAQPATARVHPADAAALAAAIGDAPLAIVADPQLAPGALAIRSATLELAHDWRSRSDELRAAIAAALATALEGARS
jgi:flagellar biosynthesis/type III secretory pathway protein FliH